MSQVPTIPRLYRTEIEVAANAAVAMHRAGLLKKGVTAREMADAIGVTMEDLRLASIRLERVPARRFGPADEPTRAAPPTPLPHIGTKGRDPQASVTNGDRRPKVAVPDPGNPYVGEFRRPKIQEVQTLQTYTEAGRKRAAERIFAEWRVRGNLDCTRCGKPIYSGCDAVVEGAHHAEKCP